jgi:hypothetical protein
MPTVTPAKYPIKCVKVNFCFYVLLPMCLYVILGTFRNSTGQRITLYHRWRLWLIKPWHSLHLYMYNSCVTKQKDRYIYLQTFGAYKNVIKPNLFFNFKLPIITAFLIKKCRYISVNEQACKRQSFRSATM